MKNGMVAALLVVAILAGAGVGYLVGSQRVTTTTTTTAISCPSATTQEYSPSGFRVEVSYQGPWNATISTYSTFATTPAYLLLTCHYGGSGTAYVYLPQSQLLDPNGLETVMGAGHKLDSSNGTLTVTVTYSGLSRYNRTTLPFGSATIQLNEYQAKGTTSYTS